MRSTRLALFLLAGLLPAALTCGGDSTGPQLPAALNLVSGSGQSGVVGQALPSPLVVKVVDASGAGVPGVPVTWSVASGGGSFSPDSSTTDAQGLASTTWTLGPLAGSNSATASVAGVAAVTPVSFTASAQAGPAAKLAFTVQPSAVVAGVAMSPAVQVVVQDAQGNTVTSATTSVTLAITSGTGTTGAVFGGTLTQAAANGVAAFSNLTMDKVGTGYTLAATATSLTSATSAAFAVSPGAATKLAFTVQPSAVVAGAAITPAVQVVVQDAQGNTVTSATTSVTLAITSGTGMTGAVLGGTLTQAAANGVATFSNVFVTQPSAIVRNALFNPTVQVALRDASGNPIPGASATITLALGSNPGGGSLAGPLSVSTASRVATSAVLSETAAGSGYTLVATASGYIAATSQVFDVAAHGPAVALAFVTQPASAGYLVNISPSVRVAVQDQYGNAVTSSPASLALTLSTNPSGATLNGGGTVAAVAGIATFANLNIDRAGTGYKLTASVTSGPALPSVTSNSFNVSQIGTVVPSATAINGMVRDGSTIYFTERGSATGAVRMVAATGGPVTALATDLLQPVAIATDGANVYWIETADGGTAQASIRRRVIAGGTTETVAAGLTIANGGRWLRYEAGYLYWIQGATVRRVSASATNGTTTILVTDSLAIKDMTVNAGTVYYFTAYSSYSSPGSIRSVPAAGGANGLVAANVRATSASDGAMLVIGSDLYFGDANHSYTCVASVPVTGGTASCLNSMSGVQEAYAFATDGASLYTVLQVFTIVSVWRFPLSDFASPTRLVPGHQWYIGDQSRLLLVDAQSVYFNANLQSSGQAVPTGLMKQGK